MTERRQKLRLLEQKIIEVTRLLEYLKQENSRLKQELEATAVQNGQLIEKNKKAQIEILSIIENLEASPAHTSNGR